MRLTKDFETFATEIDVRLPHKGIQKRGAVSDWPIPAEDLDAYFRHFVELTNADVALTFTKSPQNWASGLVIGTSHDGSKVIFCTSAGQVKIWDVAGATLTDGASGVTDCIAISSVPGGEFTGELTVFAGTSAKYSTDFGASVSTLSAWTGNTGKSLVVYHPDSDYPWVRRIALLATEGTEAFSSVGDLIANTNAIGTTNASYGYIDLVTANTYRHPQTAGGLGVEVGSADFVRTALNGVFAGDTEYYLNRPVGSAGISGVHPRFLRGFWWTKLLVGGDVAFAKYVNPLKAPPGQTFTPHDVVSPSTPYFIPSTTSAPFTINGTRIFDWDVEGYLWMSRDCVNWTRIAQASQARALGDRLLIVTPSNEIYVSGKII